MKKLFTFLFATIIGLSSYGQSNTYFHDKIDTTIYATTTGTNTYTGTNLDPNFNVARYNRGLLISTFFVNGNTTAATYKLVTRTGTLSTLPIKKQGGAALVSGDIPDSSAVELLFYGSFWRLIGIHKPTDAWLLTGNSGTTAGTNFLGTTDDVSLMFKINNTQSGLINRLALNTGFGYRTIIGTTSGVSNTAFGYQALDANTTGSYNTAVGQDALGANVGAGEANTALGAQALLVNTNGDNNVAMGASALASNTTANENTAIGYNALTNNITGKFNTALGDQALPTLTTGSSNTALGKHAGRLNLTGSRNVFLGDSAGVDYLGSDRFFLGNTLLPYLMSADFTTGNVGIGVLTTAPTSRLHIVATGGTSATWNQRNYASDGITLLFGSRDDGYISAGLSSTALTIGLNAGFASTKANTVFGVNALSSISAGQYNIAIGSYALNHADNDNNTGVGSDALYTLTTGHENTSIGRQSAFSLLSGSGNTVMGYQTLYTNSAGQRNSAFGQYAGYYCTGSDNVFLGYQAGQQQTTESNQLFIDNQNRVTSAAEKISALIYGVFNATVTSQELHFNSGIVDINGRLETKQGTDVASSSTITLTYTGNVFELTGTTAVNFITTTGWQEGSEITLIANENVTINDDAGGGNIRLAGNANFSMTADDVLTIVYSSTTAGGIIFREKSRSVN